jgi:hypothetical protein
MQMTKYLAGNLQRDFSSQGFFSLVKDGCGFHIQTVILLLRSMKKGCKLSDMTTELYYITGGSARHQRVKPKIWRIFTFADARMTPLVPNPRGNYH